METENISAISQVSRATFSPRPSRGHLLPRVFLPSALSAFLSQRIPPRYTTLLPPFPLMCSASPALHYPLAPFLLMCSSRAGTSGVAASSRRLLHPSRPRQPSPDSLPLRSSLLLLVSLILSPSVHLSASLTPDERFPQTRSAVWASPCFSRFPISSVCPLFCLLRS